MCSHVMFVWYFLLILAFTWIILDSAKMCFISCELHCVHSLCRLPSTYKFSADVELYKYREIFQW
uniref:Putative ovule protein n=1 Tax=Solanum chacoense TaxID=4108 RepID=A0A0V0I3U7_SOLCH